ncbi:MAG: fibronectin type III domain-containing protein [Candidatus Margulisiibacteriota bacterium]
MSFKKLGTFAFISLVGISVSIAQPLPPQKVQASNNTINNAIKITWSPSPSENVFSYNVYREGKLIADNITSLNYQDNDVIWGTEYSYIIKGVDARGAEGDPSKETIGRSGDKLPPESSLQTEKDSPNAYLGKIYTNAASVSFNVTASDHPAKEPYPKNAQSGVAKIKLWESSLGEQKNGWQEIESEYNVVGPKEYPGMSTEIAPVEGDREIYSKCMDHNGNIQVSTGRLSVVYDSTPPQINEFKVTPPVASSPDIKISWKCDDNYSPLVKPELMIDPKPTGAMPEGFFSDLESNMSFKLPNKDGEYYIDFSVIDLAGNMSSPRSETVLLDQVPIEGTLTIDDGATWTGQADVTLNYTSNKPEERVSVFFSNDENEAEKIQPTDKGWEKFGWGEKSGWKIAVDEEAEWDQDKTVYIKLMDDASPPHVSEVISAVIHFGEPKASEERADTLTPSSASGGMIEEVRIDDRLVKEGEKITSTKRPKFFARIVNHNGIDSVKIKDEFEGGQKEYRITEYRSQKPSKLDAYNIGEVEIEFTPEENLEEGEHVFTISASDLNGETAEFSTPAEISSVKVVGQVVPFPSPYRKSKDSEITIGYELATPSEIDIHIMAISGETIKRIYCREGEEGGKSGYNRVKWDARTTFGDSLAIGIYLGVVTAKKEQKILGKFKLVVID